MLRSGPAWVSAARLGRSPAPPPPAGVPWAGVAPRPPQASGTARWAFHRGAGRLPCWHQAFPQSASCPCPRSSRRPPLRESARPGSWRPLRARGGGRRSLAWVGTPSNATARRGAAKAGGREKRQEAAAAFHIPSR